MSSLHLCFLSILSDVIEKCLDKTVRRRLTKYQEVMGKRPQNNYKLSLIHEVLSRADISFREFEMKAFGDTFISEDYHDVGPISTYTLHDLLRLLRHNGIRLEGCLSNIPANVHRTKSLTICYLIAARDALGFGSITEVLWNLREMRSVAG